MAPYPVDSTVISSTQISLPVPGYLLTTGGLLTIQVQNAVNMFSNSVTFTITRRAARSNCRSQPSTTVTDAPTLLRAKSRSAAPLPGRFPGWKYAAQRGPDYLRQFLRPRAGLAASPAAQRQIAKSGGPSPSAPPPPGFNLRPTLPAGFLPTAVVTGDFNGDGHIDWAVANGGDNNIWIYLGNGDGTAQIPTIVPLKGAAPTALAVADMNHDGKLDLVVAEADSWSRWGSCWAMGTALLGPNLSFTCPGAPESLAVADFNGDGNPGCGGRHGRGPVSTGQLAFLPGDGTGKLGSARYPLRTDQRWPI